ncbi:MAG: hypothetical protein ACXWE7_11045 [Nitrososphaeraceae archaeon]
MSYRDINEKVFEKLNELERTKLGKKAEALRPEQIFRIFPNDQILTEDKAVSFLQKETSLDESTIVTSINKLIKDKKIITAFDRKGKLHLRKMKK